MTVKKLHAIWKMRIAVSPHLSNWVKLARINTIPQSVLLVMLGATLGSKRVLPDVSRELVMTAALTAASTTQAMVVNDYQDFVLKRDTAYSKPDKPMVRQQIRPKTIKKAFLIHRHTLLHSYETIQC